MTPFFLYIYAWLSLGATLYYAPSLRLGSYFWVWWSGEEVMEYQIFPRPPWVLDVLLLLHVFLIANVARLPLEWVGFVFLWWLLPYVFSRTRSVFQPLGFSLLTTNRLLALAGFIFFFALLRIPMPALISYFFMGAWWGLHMVALLVMLGNGVLGRGQTRIGPVILYFCTVQIAPLVLLIWRGRWS